MKVGKVIGPMELLRSAQALGQEKCVLVSSEEKNVAALDRAGAKPGERVLLVTGSAAERYCMETPVDAVVVAVVNENVLGSEEPLRNAEKSFQQTMAEAGEY